MELRFAVDSSFTTPGFVSGTVTEDVKGPDGRTAIPASSAITLAVRVIGKKGTVSEVVLGTYTVLIAGREYSLSDGHADAATLTFTEDAGKGPGHSSVHLSYGYPLTFKLDQAVQLR